MSKRNVFRTRRTATTLAVGLGASLALGAGVALAAEPVVHGVSVLSADSATAFGESLKAQAETQKKVADKERAEKAAKAEQAKRAADKERADRSQVRNLADAWVKPVDEYVIGQPFGKDGNMWANKHSGQDLVVPSGTAVKAVHKGVVVKAGANGGGDGAAYGNAIVIKHDDNTYSQYAHLSSVAVQVGQSVTAGQQIGLSGSTGNSSGPHLHFEIRTTPNYGSSVEPLGFLSGHGEKL
ncbi:M23 family metallopeptidase [Streptomyces mobaraensis NBRC 13819 = DSM 40847]|uniref:M23 family metallopeptidase n=2 Tax=Streptomyces mobaraensis TaxID=35621 RepID=A0A5N5WAE8_STRMB|nr:M23 family metallopeptidase [Streptomyces mobaraensis]EME98319.1 peptidase [Streptomyces mobaraensis NBRC 13819 = DSM 40847]KAB7847822.1 M23 family metallopeptidase [Streptomyces mobaraensis]QTT75049.1 M23 family metallopeptidase [Streptomyces mobaraensis NBRC 13819 = DSM 40847]